MVGEGRQTVDLAKEKEAVWTRGAPLEFTHQPMLLVPEDPTSQAVAHRLDLRLPFNPQDAGMMPKSTLPLALCRTEVPTPAQVALGLAPVHVHLWHETLHAKRRLVVTGRVEDAIQILFVRASHKLLNRLRAKMTPIGNSSINASAWMVLQRRIAAQLCTYPTQRRPPCNLHLSRPFLTAVSCSEKECLTSTPFVLPSATVAKLTLEHISTGSQVGMALSSLAGFPAIDSTETMEHGRAHPYEIVGQLLAKRKPSTDPAPVSVLDFDAAHAVELVTSPSTSTSTVCTTAAPMRSLTYSREKDVSQRQAARSSVVDQPGFRYMFGLTGIGAAAALQPRLSSAGYEPAQARCACDLAPVLSSTNTVLSIGLTGQQ
jgi:hypothetical protein